MKPTVATLKSFIRKNRENLLVKVRSEFDGMIDGQQWHKGAEFEPAKPSDKVFSNNLGISGVWLVSSRNWVSQFEENGLHGFKVSNCCGSFEFAVRA